MTDGGAGQSSTGTQFAAMDSATDESFADTDVEEHTLPCEKDKLYVRVILRDDAGMAYVGVEYELAVGDEILKGRTGDDGMVEQLVPKTATTATLTVWVDGKDDDETPIEWTLALDQIDPLTMDTGKSARLLNFGFVETDDAGKEITAADVALADFGFWMGLLPTELEKNAVAKLGGVYSPSATEMPMMPADDEEFDDYLGLL